MGQLFDSCEIEEEDEIAFEVEENQMELVQQKNSPPKCIVRTKIQFETTTV